MVSLQQLTGPGLVWPSGRSSLRANHRPSFGYIVDVDQLLQAPKLGWRGEQDSTAEALGIPVISGVPPIVIITPAQQDKHLYEHAPRRRAR